MVWSVELPSILCCLLRGRDIIREVLQSVSRENTADIENTSISSCDMCDMCKGKEHN